MNTAHRHRDNISIHSFDQPDKFLLIANTRNTLESDYGAIFS